MDGHRVGRQHCRDLERFAVESEAPSEARRAGLCGRVQPRWSDAGHRQRRWPCGDLDRERRSEATRDPEHGDAVYCAAFSPDGKILATVGGNGDGGDTVCRLWDSSTLTLVTEYPGHTFPVYGVAFLSGRPVAGHFKSR